MVTEGEIKGEDGWLEDDSERKERLGTERIFH